MSQNEYGVLQSVQTQDLVDEINAMAVEGWQLASYHPNESDDGAGIHRAVMCRVTPVPSVSTHPLIEAGLTPAKLSLVQQIADDLGLSIEEWLDSVLNGILEQYRNKRALAALRSQDKKDKESF